MGSSAGPERSALWVISTGTFCSSHRGGRSSQVSGVGFPFLFNIQLMMSLSGLKNQVMLANAVSLNVKNSKCCQPHCLQRCLKHSELEKRSQLPGNGNKLLQNLSKLFPFLLAVVLDFQFRRKIVQAKLDRLHSKIPLSLPFLSGHNANKILFFSNFE